MLQHLYEDCALISLPFEIGSIKDIDNHLNWMIKTLHWKTVDSLKITFPFKRLQTSPSLHKRS